MKKFLDQNYCQSSYKHFSLVYVSHTWTVQAGTLEIRMKTILAEIDKNRYESKKP